MKKPRLPKTDSIQELAEFWDRHDLTDFDDELEEVTEPVFVRATGVQVPLEPTEIEALEQLAQAEGVSREDLIGAWVRQELARRGDGRPTNR